MNTGTRNFSVLAVALALTACSTVSVTTDYDHAASFGKYKTYSLAPAKQGQVLSPSSDAALRDALRTELGARGLTEATRGRGDLAIVPQVFTQQKTSVQQYSTWGYGYGGWPYGFGSYGLWAGAPSTYLDVNQYTEGTLILDVVDTHTKKLVFRGTASAVAGGPSSNATNIRTAVRKMVDALPAGATR
jgi:hypothetical protein